MSLIGTKVQPFKSNAFKDGEFTEVTEQDFMGHWNVVLFYPADFSFVCPTELEDLQNEYEKLKLLGVEIYSISTDTHFSHKAWHDSSPTIKKIKYTMIGDPAHVISRNFEVLNESTGLADRGTFIIDPDGIIQAIEINAGGIGRDASTLINKIKAAQYINKNSNEVCPAKWKEKSQTLTPGIDLVGKI